MSYNLRSRTSDSPMSRSRSPSPSPSRNSSCSSTHGNPMGSETLDFGKTAQKAAGSFYETVLKTSAMTYAMVLILAILGGGSLIRLYGETCGLNILDPSTWLRATITIGSPWCKALNWVGYMATSIVEHLWLHLFGLLVTSLVAYVPGKFTSRSPGTYHDQRTV